MDSGEGPSTVDRDALTELSHTVSQTTLTLFSAGSVIDTLASVTELAVTTIEGCDYAGLFLMEGSAVTTPVHTDPAALKADALQHQTAEGPCLDAIAHRLIVYADDLESDLRWPDFSPRATSTGIRSVLSLPLTPSSQMGALNLYRATRPYSESSIEPMRRFWRLWPVSHFLLRTPMRTKNAEQRTSMLPSALARSLVRPQGSSWKESASRPTKPSTFCVEHPST